MVSARSFSAVQAASWHSGLLSTPGLLKYTEPYRLPTRCPARAPPRPAALFRNRDNRNGRRRPTPTKSRYCAMKPDVGQFGGGDISTGGRPWRGEVHRGERPPGSVGNRTPVVVPLGVSELSASGGLRNPSATRRDISGGRHRSGTNRGTAAAPLPAFCLA